MLGRSYEAAFLMKKTRMYRRERNRIECIGKRFLIPICATITQTILAKELTKGIRNYLIEGVSGTGKTSVCNELQRRGYQAIHGGRP